MSNIYRVGEGVYGLASLAGKIVYEHEGRYTPVPDVFKHDAGHLAADMGGWSLGISQVEPVTPQDWQSEGRPTRGQFVIAARVRIDNEPAVWVLGMVEDPYFQPGSTGWPISIRLVNDDGTVDYDREPVGAYAWVNVDSDYLPKAEPTIEEAPATTELDTLRSQVETLILEKAAAERQLEEFKVNVVTTAMSYARDHGHEDAVKALLESIGLEVIDPEPPLWRFTVNVQYTVEGVRDDDDKMDEPSESFIRDSISENYLTMDGDWAGVAVDTYEIDVTDIEKA